MYEYDKSTSPCSVVPALFLGFFEVYGTHLNPDNMEAGKEVLKGLPTLVYYSRKHAGTPKISPKAGNM